MIDTHSNSTSLQSNSTPQRLDDVRKRLPVVALATLAIWLGLLTILGLWLNRLPVEPDVSPVEARLIDLSSGGVGAGGGSSSAGASKASAQPVSRVKPERVERHAIALLPRPKRPAATRRHKYELNSVVASSIRTAHLDLPSAVPASLEPPIKVVPSVSGANSFTSLGHENAAGGTGVRRDAGSGSGGGIGSGAGSAAGTGGSGPRPIYAPIPSIPDDMRDEVMQVTAVVMFHVDRDGRATVTLVTPTDYSTLDALIIETLQQWRFIPAVSNGVRIESDAQMRLVITVR